MSDPIASAEAELRRLLDIMARCATRAGCPWDREQNFATIAPYTIEEAYEVADAIARRISLRSGRTGRPVVAGRLHAHGRGGRPFRFEDVAAGASRQNGLRHPHVFGDAADTRLPGSNHGLGGAQVGRTRG